MLIVLVILFIGIPLIKEEMENQSYREQCRRREWDICLSRWEVNV